MKLPENLPRFDSVTPEEAQRLLCTCEYGFMPPRPECVSFSETLGNKEFCAGKAVLHKVTATVEINGKSFSFPFSYVRPNAKESVPAVVLINFRGNIPDLYIPTEELADLGIAVASFDYQEVSPDNGDFESLAGGFLGVDRSDPHAPGKIGGNLRDGAFLCPGKIIRQSRCQLCNICNGHPGRRQITAGLSGRRHHKPKFKILLKHQPTACPKQAFRIRRRMDIPYSIGERAEGCPCQNVRRKRFFNLRGN